MADTVWVRYGATFIIDQDMTSATPRVQRFAMNSAGRDFAVGDIHGCFGKLTAALSSVQFSPSTDRLFSVGDLVDRGPESDQVAEWLELPWFHAICGNHDLMTWRTAIGDPLEEVDHMAHGGQWLNACGDELRRRIAQGLRGLPLGIEVETPGGVVGLVHADFPYDDWNAIHRSSFSAEDEDTCLWSIARYRSQYTQPVRNVKALVHGHMTLSKMAQLGNVYYIDTGGWLDGGKFTLLNLHTLTAIRS